MVFADRTYFRCALVVAMAVCIGAAVQLLPANFYPGYIAAVLIVAFLSAWFAFELRHANARWEATLSSMVDGVVVVDRRGCVKFVNPAAEAMTGWTTREAKKKKVEEVFRLVAEKTREACNTPMEALLVEGKTFRATRPKILISRVGHEVWVEESSAPVRSQSGAVVGAILVFRDITARREIQDQVSQSQRMDAVGRLASGVAGDFNDLLTVMTGYSEMLRMDLDEGDHRQRFADEIYVAADRAAALTRQLTALSKKQPGTMKVLDLGATITSLETMLRRLLGDRIDLMIMSNSGRVKADASQLEQVIVNLAMNSRDAMPDGGKFVIEIGSLEIEEGHADKWPGVKPGSYMTMAVSDTGIGMDAETRAHLFEPFFTTKSNEKGTGLGLSIVYGIIQQSRGYINVFSHLGAGTIFEIFLPREKGTAEIVLAPTEHRKQRGSETVLIADDEEGVRKLVHAVLATNGYKVLEARDGVEALALFEANQLEVRAVVTDVVMPKMTGIELGEHLRRIKPAMPILYITGYHDKSGGGEGASGDDEGVQAFLHKPFTPNALLIQLRELLDKSRAATLKP